MILGIGDLLPSPLESVKHESYDPNWFSALFAIEDQHFWFRARNQVIATLVSQITAGLTLGYQVLEVGCGTGNVLRVLERVCSSGTVIGMDLYAEGLQFARQRSSCLLVQGDVHEPPCGARFDLIGLFDVLEHLPDDLHVLRDLRRLLVPGGRLLLTVPSHPSLWSYFDEVSCHCRRYQLAELKSKMIQTGFQIEYITEYMFSIFPLVWLGRRLMAFTNRRPVVVPGSHHKLAASELHITPIINDLLTWLLMQETRLIARRYALPIGTSLVAVARKDSG